MRRSRAPSIRKNTPNKPANFIIDSANVPESVAELLDSKENHVKVLETLGKKTKAEVPLAEIEKNENKIVFQIVWGKLSTKKHKTWEGDGTVEISGKTATLKDEEGKYLGSATNIKVEEYVEGARIIIGSKEVEFIEKIEKKAAESGSNPPAAKKIKQDPIIPSFKSLNKPSCSTTNLEELNRITMNAPSFEHQWKYNTAKKPVCEVSVPECLAKELRPHQREGVLFLYDCVMGFKVDDYFGAILADEMGLGKTLQCISLFYMLMKQGPYGEKVVKRVLIVSPSSLVENWNKEITKWLKDERIFTYTVSPKNQLKKFAQSPHIPILIISYEMLVKQCEELENIRFDLMICDEGHRLKNINSKAVTILDKIESKKRILLTGTPVQNDLQEFYSLLNFVNPGLLGNYQEFKNKYETPIVQSQQPNILPQYQALGKERAKELNKIVSSFVLRRTQEVINKYLPQKQEFVVFCAPSKLQEKLLRQVLNVYNDHLSTNFSPLQLITILKKICNHPSLIQATKENKNDPIIKMLNDLLPPWDKMGPYDSGKLAVLDTLLEELIGKREKIVLVSYYAKTLDMLMGLCEHYNYKFCRLDGTTPSADRNKIVTAFNSSNSDTFVFLLSAKAGGAGLNLIGASRLLLFDNDWNPASDLQAMSRIWRDGQVKNVFIYRLITGASIEEKIFQRQISKTSLSGCVVDQKQNLNNLKLSAEELKDLFTIPDNYEACLTHEMLNCSCEGDGQIPEPTKKKTSEQSPEENEFQIKLSKKNSKSNLHSLKMQELMRWEHHKAPFSGEMMLETCLQNCDGIIFIFRNKSNSSNAIQNSL